MKSMVMAMLLATVTVAGEMRFQTAQPISADRVGVAGANQSRWMVEGGDDTFLLLWRDDRHSWPRSTGSGFLAARIAPDGTVLDEVPLFLPIDVNAVTRANDGWIVVGTGGIARISDEGTLSEIKPVPASPPGPYLSIQGAAWTGEALVVLRAEYIFPSSQSPSFTGGAVAMSFDSDLNHIATHTLTDQPALGLGVAGDGVSSVMLVYRTRPDVDGIRAAVFDRNGEYRKDRIIHTVPGFRPTCGIVATGSGTYAVALGPDLPDSKRLEVLAVDTDFRRAYAGTVNGHWFPVGSPRSMFWDGSAVTMYTLMPSIKGAAQDLAVARFRPGDEQELTTERLMSWELNSGFTVGRAGNRGLIGRLPFFQATFALRGRMFTEPEELKTNATFRTFGVDRGAFAQGQAAGVSAENQSLVAWLERASLSNPFNLYATRLDRNGKVLDPESLLLGQSPCDRKPVVATNGSDFLAVWTTFNQTRVAAVRAQGTFETKAMSLRVATDCVAMRLASNGEDFLLVWPEKRANLALWDLLAVRLRSDGTAIDTKPIILANAFSNANGQDVRLAIASDGRDYLVAWDKSALRVTKDGAALNRFQPILLGDPIVRTWWNGRTYVVHTFGGLLRIGTDGTGGAPLGKIPFPEGVGLGANGLCDAGGCSFALLSWPADRSWYGAALGRLDDDGTTFTLRTTPVAGFVYPKEPFQDSPYQETFLLDAGRLLFVHRIAHHQAPYAGVQRLVVTPVGIPRTRAVTH